MSFALVDGRLRRDGEPFFAVGFNYHPSVAGCDYWGEWDGPGLRRDLRAMASHGANTVRVFAFWRDFEPEPGVYAADALRRLRELVGVAAEHGLACIVSLLTLWMNGEVLDVPWRRGRSLWRDEELLARERAYAERVARTLADCGNVLAYDLGDELVHVDGGEACTLGRADAAAWQRQLADAVRRGHPGALVLMANELSTILGSHPFGPDNRCGLDLAGVHGFGLWNPFAIEALGGSKARMLPGFLAALAQADGPALVDELGAYGLAEEHVGAYLRTAAGSALANGALGVIVWCWQDVLATGAPYRRRPHERLVGLVRADGSCKPAMAAFERVAAEARALAGSEPAVAEIAIYLPEPPPSGDAAYLAPEGDAGTGLFYAYLLLKRAHLPVTFTREPERHRFVVCPSVRSLHLLDAERLERYVRAGGNLYYSSGSCLDGFGGESLLGIVIDDVVLEAVERSFSYRGHRYDVRWSPGGDGARRARVRARAARVLATFDDGGPALTRHWLGDGTATCLNAPYEAQLDCAHRLDAHVWERLYVDLAADVGVAPLADDAPPQLELAPLTRDRESLVLAVNHGPEPVELRIAWPPGSPPRLHTVPAHDTELLRAA